MGVPGVPAKPQARGGGGAVPLPLPRAHDAASANACAECSGDLPTSGPKAQCVVCASAFHLTCVGINSAFWAAQAAGWRCFAC